MELLGPLVEVLLWFMLGAAACVIVVSVVKAVMNLGDDE